MNYPKELEPHMTKYAKSSSRIGAGWFPIVIDLYNKLVEAYPDFEIDVVKEKFGELRFYISGYSSEQIVKDRMVAIISAGETATETICDVCGKEGKKTLLNDYLLATRCEEHSKEI